MRTVHMGILALAVALLGGCYSPWISRADNPSPCPRDLLPSGACGAEGTNCWYMQNLGNSAAPQTWQRCACTGGTWTCVNDSPYLHADSGADTGAD